MYVFVVVLCFFRQKTEYEMRISDWSSDVCSSDRYEVRASIDGTSGKTEIECILAGLHASVVVCVRLLPHMRGVVVDHLANYLWGWGKRSEERRVGKECVSTSRSRWARDN